MRPVRIPPGTTPPQEWLDKASALTEQLRNATEKERLRLIFKNRKLWRDKALVDWLTNIHHRKCWYSEAKESVSSYHVDHFRPKGRATQTDGEERPGYWWLTFDWKNYRLSGQLLNVKKRDCFPVEFSQLASPDDPRTLDMEGRVLLDPTSDEAWLITFEKSDDGDCIAEPTPGIAEHDLQRVRATIDILGLNRLALLNKNRAGVWDCCLSRIQDYKNADTENLLHTRNALKLIAARAIALMCSEESEFSSVAQACVAKLAPLALRHLVNDLLRRPALLKTAA